MTEYLLRGTRMVVAAVVSLHVFLLRLTTTLADRKVAKADKRVETAKSGLEFAQQAVRYARLSVREFKDQQIIASNSARNVRTAAQAECSFYGRSL